MSLSKTKDTILGLLGNMVIVPCNPDDESFFQISEGFVQLIKQQNWNEDKHYDLRIQIYSAIISYLASQTQEKLPYAVPYVNSNDKIFIGNEKFKEEANKLMDYCFAQILEAITTLNETKDQHLMQLNFTCLRSANILISNAQVNVKKVNSYVNKMFKMADAYMQEHNGKPGLADTDKISRRYVDLTYEAFRRKKEAQASEATMKQNIETTRDSTASSASFVPS
jgi:hypothetical protein